MSKPSEKAMQLAKDILHDFGHPKCQEQDAVNAVASLIDAHTAEALSEHKRVLDVAGKALYLCWHNCVKRANEYPEHGQIVQEAKYAGEMAEQAMNQITEIRKY